MSPIRAGRWHWLFSHHQGKTKVQLNSAYPVPSCVSENTRCALEQGLDLHLVCGVYKQTSQTHCSGEPGHTRLWLCLPHGSVDPPAEPGLAAKPSLAEPKFLQDHNSPSLGWKMSSRNVWSELSGRPNVASEIPARPQTGRIRGASSPGNISQGHKEPMTLP